MYIIPEMFSFGMNCATGSANYTHLGGFEAFSLCNVDTWDGRYSGSIPYRACGIVLTGMKSDLRDSGS
jgi:hypothetical protein